MSNRHRKQLSLSLPPRILILCEGESEIKYLKGYQGEEQNRRKLSGAQIELYQPDNYSPYGLLTEAKKRAAEAKHEKYPFKQIWIVFDRDGLENIPKTYYEAAAAGINIAFSLISFEYWLLLHFEKTSRHFPNCDALVHYIESRNYINDYCKTNYYQSIKNFQDVAIGNAKWLHMHNYSDLSRGIKHYELAAYTNFDELFIALKKLISDPG